ncbi:hypothetical protein B9Z55_003094 [Caenorhabditis nigoni]|uniref:F-box domain-containing protein n=1 Tax=Caenorhabditis nigoni TaxID=1611254 RepID=A0A2G5VNW5_9PELO|nr:hypothetical protein B9Z55_003094 [Caenorhabditis nigoni]
MDAQSTAKFPNVFKLYPVLREVLENMEPAELINLSFCSKRTLNTVKPVCTNIGQQMEIGFKFDDTKTVTFACPDVRWEASWQQGPEVTFWKTWRSSQTKIEHIFQLFNSPNFAAKLDLDIDPKTTKSMIEWAKQRETVLSHLYYCGTSGRQASKLLRTFHNCGRLSLAGNLSQRFRVNFPLESPILIIHNAHWVTMENICSFKGQAIAVLQSSLRNGNLNVFLKEWKSGSRRVDLNLYLMMSFTYLDISTIVLDIPHVARRWIRKTDNKETILYEVFNDDNTMVASMFYEEPLFRKMIIIFRDSQDRL